MEDLAQRRGTDASFVEGAVARDYTGVVRFDLAGQDEAGRQGHDRQEGDAGGVAG